MTDHLPMKPKLGVSPLPPPFARTSLHAAQQAAQKLEATFLAEMLKAAGFGEQVNSFSGGTGEDQFASFHRQAVADKIAEAGGIGLSEHFLNAMLETSND
ncbi:MULTISPECIES: rod-binding protein [Roseovarius]|uniref:rod-binding protein n=1 Tax=Roseovarius TaxID=74030 RepID=UPI00273D1C60|nr:MULTISPECIES: rod-binding protein [unclassified Roseovarius]